ncbi:hypothetical protein [Halioxenophilus sp. WMMB6]|uniref:hypothetical protein n=1 Tax=Halioxenophilus sp. WMMB6 TaxID=3073815 RepID=UPI00295F2907|nr:hypothetical protein [Halioxenophilus sp. WMMB6]
MDQATNLIDQASHITIDQTDIDYADAKERVCDLKAQSEYHTCRADVLLTAARDSSNCTNIPLDAQVEIGITLGVANLTIRAGGSGQTILESCRFEIRQYTLVNLEICEANFSEELSHCVH